MTASDRGPGRGVLLLSPRADLGTGSVPSDEDLFTVLVAAAEELEAERPLARPRAIELFAPLAEPMTALLPVALGAVGAAVRPHPDREEELHGLAGRDPAGPDDGPSLWLIGGAFAGSGSAPSGGYGLALWSDRQKGAGAPGPGTGPDPRLRGLGAVATAARGRFDGPLLIIENPPVPSGTDLSRSVALDRLSEGAYVPRPRYLENLPSRWRYAADRCGVCGHVTFPVRGYCRDCGEAASLLRVELPRRGGRIASITTIRPGAQPTEFDWRVDAAGAYDVALVELSDGVLVTAQVADAPPATLRVGDRVDTALRRLYAMEGEWRYGRKAVPARGSGSVAPAADRGSAGQGVASQPS